MTRDCNGVEGGSVTRGARGRCFLHLLTDLTDDNPRFFQDFHFPLPQPPST